MTFPLVRLPFLAFKHVVESMRLREKFLLSTMSKKCRYLVKMSVSGEQFSLRVDRCSGRFMLSDKPQSLFFLKTPNNVQRYQKPFPDTVIWDKPIDSIIEFYAEVFNRPSICLSIYSLNDYHNSIAFFETLNLRINEIRYFCSDGQLQKALDTFEHIPILTLYFNPPTEFDFNPEKSYNFDKIEICFPEKLSSVPWHKNLLFCLKSCKRVKMEDIRYRTQDLIDFFAHWISGSRMEYLKVNFGTDEFATIFKTLGQVIPVNEVIFYGKMKKYWFSHGQCYMIQQKQNGPKAIVFMEMDEVTLTTKFEPILNN